VGRAVIVVATEAAKLFHPGKRWFWWDSGFPLRGDIAASHNGCIGGRQSTVSRVSSQWEGVSMVKGDTLVPCREIEGVAAIPPGDGSAQWPP
jgi:hypothetical protein